MFCEKLCCMGIWFRHQIVSSSFGCDKFFLTFSIVFPKTALFICLKKSFSESFFASVLSLLLISMYGFNHSSWLKLITLWTFFKIKPWFKASFKLFVLITYSLLSSKLVTNFSTFPSFFLSGKNGKSLWSSCNLIRY